MRRETAAYAALLAASAVLYLHALGASPLLEPDEGRYAEIAREMVASGDWLVPRCDGLLYLQKPPLAYWLTATAYRLFGTGEGTARLGAALAAIGTIVITLWFGASRFGTAAGLAAGAMLATTPLFHLIGRLAILDMPLTFFLTLAIVALQRAMDRGQRRWQLAAGLAIGAAVLTKGLVGVALPVGVVLGAAVVERDWGVVRRALGPLTLVPALLVPLPWFWAVAREVPGFLGFFFVRHHLLRYAVGGKIGHAHPVWYLPLVFLAGALPWSLLRVAAAVRERASAWRDPARRTERYLDVWMLGVIAFFAASRLSLATYVCPAFVPLALRTGRAWAEGRTGRRAPAIWAALAALTLVLALLPPALYAGIAGRLVYRRWWGEMMAVRPMLALAALVVLPGAMWATIGWRRGVALGALAGTLAIGLAITESARSAFPSAAVLGAVVRARGGEADRIVSYGGLLFGLPFYARRRTVVVAWAGAGDLGPSTSRAIVWSERRLVRAWNGRRRLFLVIAPDRWRGLRRKLRRPASVLGYERGHVLVTNAPLGIRPPAS